MVVHSQDLEDHYGSEDESYGSRIQHDLEVIVFREDGSIMMNGRS